MVTFMALVMLTGQASAIGLIRDAEIEALLREYTDPILIAAGLQPDAVDIYIVNDPSLNAFVTGGKNIFLHTGLIVEAERPLELIGVIAHETGHISGGHLVRRSEGARAATLPMLLGLGVGIIAALAGAPDLGMAAIAGGQHIAMMEMLAYTRVQESSADQAAVTFMNRAELSPDGILSFFEKFRYTEVFSAHSQHVPPYWRSHPMSSDRIAALTSRVESSKFNGQPDSDESVHRFSMMQGKLRGFIDHPQSTLRRYPPEDVSAEARYARAIALYRLVEVDEALAEVDALSKDEPDNAYFQELRGQILFESGRVAEAIPYHAKSVELAPGEALLRVNLAQAMIAEAGSEKDLEKTAEARGHLLAALATDEDNPFTYHQLAITYAREGNEGMAALYTAEQHYHAGNIAGATSFAVRARHYLEKNTPAWHRASDILNVASNLREDSKRRS
jgi:predicted Zn-dependent protease